MVEEHGINSEEYDFILESLSRDPTITELGIFSAMWSEHCSYKSSKYWLSQLPTKNDFVIQGPGENAGVIDIGDIYYFFLFIFVRKFCFIIFNSY